MDEKQKKEYTKNTIRLDSGARITEVLLRYFKGRGSAQIQKKTGTQSDIIKVAEKLFT